MFSAEYNSPQLYQDALKYEAKQTPNQWIIPKNELSKYGINALADTNYIELRKKSPQTLLGKNNKLKTESDISLRQIYQTDELIQLPEKPFLPTIGIRKPEYPEPNKINLYYKEKGFSLVDYDLFCKVLQVLEPQMTDELRDKDCKIFMESYKRKSLNDQEVDEYVSWVDGEGTEQLDVIVETFLLPYEYNKVPISKRLEVSLKNFVTAYANSAKYEAPQKHNITVDNIATAFSFGTLMYSLAWLYNKVKKIQGY